MEQEVPKSDGFAFSQDLLNTLSHFNSQASSIADSTWVSENSQQSLFQNAKTVDQTVPLNIGPPEVKKVKYSVPKWTKGLLKTAEENQKIKAHEYLMKKMETEHGENRRGVQEILAISKANSTMTSKLIKEATDYLSKSFKESLGEFKNELMKEAKEDTVKRIDQFEEKFETDIFELLTSMSEMKDTLQTREIQELKQGMAECQGSLQKMEKDVEQLLRKQREYHSIYLTSTPKSSTGELNVSRRRKRSLLSMEEMFEF